KPLPTSLVSYQKRLFASGIIALFLFTGSFVNASPCARLKMGVDAWVADRVDVLVKAARKAYESDNALPAYEKVLDGIADTIGQCKLSEDTDFISRYRTLLEYIGTASLD